MSLTAVQLAFRAFRLTRFVLALGGILYAATAYRIYSNRVEYAIANHINGAVLVSLKGAVSSELIRLILHTLFLVLVLAATKVPLPVNNFGPQVAGQLTVILIQALLVGKSWHEAIVRQRVLRIEERKEGLKGS